MKHKGLLFFLLAFLLLFLMAFPSLAQTPELFWRPMEFGDGVELTYRYQVGDTTKNATMTLTVEFRETIFYDYSLTMTVTTPQGADMTMTEEEVEPLFWATDRFKSGWPAPTIENLPLAATADLVLSSTPQFVVLANKEEWEKGFSVPHPRSPETTFTATITPCSAAGLTGRIMVIQGPQGTIRACISPQVGLPLSLRIEPAGQLPREFTLLKYQPLKLDIPAPFFAGEPDGFEGIEWGTDVSEFKDLVPIRTPSDRPTAYTERSATYTKKGEDLNFRGIPCQSIRYSFEDGKFAHVELTFTGTERWRALVETLTSAYGRGYEIDYSPTETKRADWEGEKTGISVEFTEHDQAGTMLIWSQELWDPWQWLRDSLFKKN